MSMVVPIHGAKPATVAQPERVGVLLVNLGTPDTADARGVRVYLRQFLSYARVIEKQVFQHADPARGRFRSFLLASLQHFTANAYDRELAGKRGGGAD